VYYAAGHWPDRQKRAAHVNDKEHWTTLVPVVLLGGRFLGAFVLDAIDNPSAKVTASSNKSKSPAMLAVLRRRVHQHRAAGWTTPLLYMVADSVALDFSGVKRLDVVGRAGGHLIWEKTELYVAYRQVDDVARSSGTKGTERYTRQLTVRSHACFCSRRTSAPAPGAGRSVAVSVSRRRRARGAAEPFVPLDTGDADEDLARVRSLDTTSASFEPDASGTRRRVLLRAMAEPLVPPAKRCRAGGDGVLGSRGSARTGK